MVPNASRPNYADLTKFLPRFKQMWAEAGRDPTTVPTTIFGGPKTLTIIKRHRDQGIARVVAT
jgi:hypothetical protein